MVMICGPSNVVNLPPSPWPGKRVLGSIPEGEQTDKEHRNHTMICDQILLIMNNSTRYLRLFPGAPSTDKAVKTVSRNLKNFLKRDLVVLVLVSSYNEVLYKVAGKCQLLREVEVLVGDSPGDGRRLT